MDIRALFATLTADERKALKEGLPAFRGLFYVRGKARAAAFEARGFKMEKCSAMIYIIEFDQSRALQDIAYEHGPAVSVVRIEEKYSDNNGAWEVAFFLDAKGREFSTGNMYDSSACFRRMSHQSLIDYVNREFNKEGSA